MSRLLALLLVLSIACGGGEGPSAPSSGVPLKDDTPADGGRLVRRLEAGVGSLNPLLSSTRDDKYLTHYLFTPMLRLDRTLQIVPGLAESWEISPDGLVYRFRLAARATHSDGTPVRPRDVLFTIEKIVDPANEAISFSSSFAHFDAKRSRVVDAHTVEVAFTKVLASQLLKFTDLVVLPEHVYSKGDFRRDFNDQAVGSGPYRLVRRHNDEFVLERRSDYWGRKPHIRTVVFKVISEQAVAWRALRKGEIDETLVTSEVWNRERNNPEVTRQIDFRRFYSRNYNFIAWNNRRAMFRDANVRRAMSMCVPIDDFIRDVYHGTARAMSGPFVPEDWAFNPDVPVIRHNPAEALKLLNAAGWRDTDGDSLLDRDGKPFRFTIHIFQGSVGQSLAQMMQSELAKIGVEMQIVTIDGAAAFDQIMAGDFDSTYLAWDLDVDPDPYALFHSTRQHPRGQNFVGYANPEIDRLLDAARGELDFEKRRALYWRMHAILAADQPYTWVVQAAAKWGVNRRVRGVEISQGYGMFFWDPGEFDWWIAPQQ